MRSLLSLPRRYPHQAALLLIAMTTLIRFWFIGSGQLDLVQDEAQYWDWSRHLQLAYYSKGPLIAWIISFFTGIFGDTEFGVRCGAVLGSLLAQLLLYWGVAGLMRRPFAALLALFIVNTTPLFLASGVLMTTDNPLMVCWLAAMFSLHAMIERPESPWPPLILALAMAVGLLAKYIMLAMAGVAFIHALLLHRQGLLPRGHLQRLLPALIIGMAVGLAPILIWNGNNDWASFRHVGRLAGIAPAALENPPLIRFDRFPEYIGSQIGLLLPWWFVFMLLGGWRSLKRLWGLGWFCDAGGLRNAEALRRDSLLCAAFWPLWGFFLLWSFHTRIYPNWSAMSYAAGFILAALALEDLLAPSPARSPDAGHNPKHPPESSPHPFAAPSFEQTTATSETAADSARDGNTEGSPRPEPGTAGPRLSQRLIPLWFILSLVIYLAIHAQEPLSRFLPPQYNPTHRLKGWSDLGRRLEEIRLAMPDPEKVFFFSDAYDVTAALAFYIPGRPVVYCADFGRRLSQYDLWPGPQGKQGWDAVYVRRVPFKKIDASLEEMFAEQGTPEAFHAKHRGRPGRSFGIMTLRDFNGYWPRISGGIY